MHYRYWPDSADLGVAASWLLAGVHRSCCQRRCEGSACEGFRMTAPRRRFHLHRGPSSESLQGRNPREVEVGRCRALWGFDRGVAGWAGPLGGGGGVVGGGGSGGWPWMRWGVGGVWGRP